ncbi:FAD-binding oxidoreductase [Marinilongibacter aquaticus]|uniref:FAD-dependent oxidoreductase n=1 Tax=Marinilongibacter aquaticus TaxID=2975157 RepID=UPI0021BDD85E|nr:FAD-dependent oxidoreductase [Marinilongibacter aquaticus]UBM58963.1 FAD-binding oxidoreductase [Marinilongibacter aquaticus]
MNRRNFFQKAGVATAALGAFGVQSCTNVPKLYGDKNFYINKGYYAIPKLKLSTDRIIKETVGLRPFRESGPRIEKSMLGNKILVHNYGHGGSGWSLSWGTGNMARNLVMSTGKKKIALLGCGTVGIATATLLQESGCEVTIYAKDVPPNVTSNLATGTWSPSSRVCAHDKATPEFQKIWEEACRFSFKRMQMSLGLNDIVSWGDEYAVRKERPKPGEGRGGGSEVFEIEGLAPHWKELSPKDHPFNAELVRRRSNMIFNIPSYLNFHLNNFLLRGGKLKIHEIKKLEDIDALKEPVVVNCLGLGAKTLFNDDELYPISGQLACLVPQTEINYKLSTKGAYFITRKDGIYLGGNGIENSYDTTPNRALSEQWVHTLSELMKDMKG